MTTQAGSVVALLQRYAQFRKDLKLSEQLRSRADELKAAAESLEAPAQRVALQREREWIKQTKLPSAEIKKSQGLIETIRALLPSDPGKIDPHVNRLVKVTEAIVSKTDKLTADSWATVVKRRQPSVDEAELKRCEQFNSEVAKVDEIRKMTRVSIAAAPLSRDSLYEIEKRWDRLRELIGSLPKGSDNPDVNRFLDAVRNGGASLEMLTDAVRQYLEETGKSQAFRIYQQR